MRQSLSLASTADSFALPDRPAGQRSEVDGSAVEKDVVVSLTEHDGLQFLDLLFPARNFRLDFWTPRPQAAAGWAADHQVPISRCQECKEIGFETTRPSRTTTALR
jgi:hypothetical protein